MFEKVNPAHPDKVADRIAGAMVDVAYSMDKNPKIAVEVLIGHDDCTIITESSVRIPYIAVRSIVDRIAGKDVFVHYLPEVQDGHLADNQKKEVRCGDNGIFRGVPVTVEQKWMAEIARAIYEKFPTDGKYILDGDRLIVCQSNAENDQIRKCLPVGLMRKAEINPLGYWTGGTNVDTGATNRKLGSDMADSITGGGLHGKDLSKADVSVNIYAWIKAQQEKKPVEISCAIGDSVVDGIPYEQIVRQAKKFIDNIGGFEKFAEWGLV